MALINCPHCGTQVSDRAKKCPHCGFTINERMGVFSDDVPEQAVTDSTSAEAVSENTSEHKKTRSRWVLGVIAIVVLLLAVGAIILFFTTRRESVVQPQQEIITSEEPVDTIPVITENGVEPFVLDASLYDISPSGSYYDTIVLVKYFTVPLGDHAVNVDEDGLKEYYELFPPDEYEEFVSFHGIGYVIMGNDTIIAFEYDKDAKIYRIQIFTPDLKLDNNIHVGLTTNEMFSSYHAKMEIAFTNEEYERVLVFKVPQVSPNIILVSNYLYSEFVLRNNDEQYYISQQIKNNERIGSIVVHNLGNEWVYYPIIPQKVKGYDDIDVIRGELWRNCF